MEGMVLNHKIDRYRGDGILLHLVVDVRPAYRPSRWAWYAVDTENGEIVEYAFEYESPAAARRAGLERLQELASCLGKTHRGYEGDVATEEPPIGRGRRLPVKRWPRSPFPS